MFPPVFLSDIGASVAQIALVLGLALVLPQVVDRQRNWHRAGLFIVAAALALRYAWWRMTETLAPFGMTWDWAASWSLFGFEAAALAGSLSGFAIMSRTRDRTAEVDANLGWWTRGPEPQPTPRVAIMIATYNEDLEVLERTVIGALALNHPNKEVMVLDDGRRDWLRDFCAPLGVRYVRRSDNKGSKAGNINNALRLLAEDAVQPDYIAVLDADFVPHLGFISRSLALFHDPTVGLVQTPQHFFNADPIQHNLGLSRSYPDEQRFFFDHIQPSRDAWGIAICCGTSSVVKWQAVQQAGGFPTTSVTEDILLTAVLQSIGWKTVYLNEPVTEGLAPEGLKEYVTQRARWCLGQMQIARSNMGPFGSTPMRLRDRWSIIDAILYWLTSFPFRLAGLCYPLLYWFFNITVVNASVPDVLSYFGVYFIWVTMTLQIVSRGLLVPLIHDVSQLLAAIPISRAALTGLLKPHGHPFSVTAKGGDRSKIVVQWRMLMPYLILLILTLAGLVIGIAFDSFAFSDAGDGKAVILFWSFFNVFVLSLTIIACVELPRSEQHIADVPERGICVGPDGPRRVWLQSLTRSTVRIRGRSYPAGTRAVIRIREVGDVEAVVLAPTQDGARLNLKPDDAQYEALVRRFYTEGEAPGVTSVRTASLIHDLARRLSFSSDR